MHAQKHTTRKKSFDRSLIFKAGLFGIGGVLLIQLFVVQIVKHDYYKAQAFAEHVKKFEIPADRGIINVSDGYQAVPLVLNDTKYEVYADPKFIQKSDEAATKLQEVIGGDSNTIKELLNKDSRYVILAKKISKDQADRVEALKIKGVGLKEVSVRTYPQGSVASHVLGFVNDDGNGQYGVEEFLNDKLTGNNGQKKIITDVNGVPLAINNDSLQTQPSPGEDVTLTIDIRLQRILEEKLKAGVERTQSQKGSAILLDPNTGQIKALANFPTYDPSNYAEQTDLSVFTNTAISGAWEPGSIMKPIMMSAAFDNGSINRSASYFDPGYKNIYDRTVTNAINYGARTMSMDDILTKSLNTGAVHLLQSIGGDDIPLSARQTWYDYLTNHYMFNKPTGIELANEQQGVVSPPDEADGAAVRYANMSFGQGLTVTPMQITAAYAALVNGGTYYKPTIVSSTEKDGVVTPNQPQVIKSGVVSPSVSAEVKDILKKTLEINNTAAVRGGYVLGAKSGTAEIADGSGNYKTDAYNGAYLGYIEGKRLEYILFVRLDEPKTSGFASFQASKVWAEISNEMINSIAISPKQ